MTESFNKSGLPDAGKKHKGLLYSFIAVVVLVGIVLLLFITELFRGEKAWQSYASEAKARGIQLEWTSYMPAPVEDSQNFASTPSLAGLFDFLPGTQTRRDTNATHFLDKMDTTLKELAKKRGLEIEKEWGNYAKAQRHDLTRIFRSVHDKRDDHSTSGISNLSPELMKRYGLVPSSPVLPTNGTPEQSISRSSPPITNEVEAAHILLELYREAYGPFLDELQQAKQRPFCRFNIKYDHEPTSEILLPHLPIMRNIAQKLKAKAIAHLTLNQPSEAFNDVALALYLGDCLKGEPCLISQLVRHAIRHVVYGTIWEGIARHQWTDDQLRQLMAGLEKDNLLEDMKNTLQAERAWGIRIIRQAAKQSNGITMNLFDSPSYEGNAPWYFLPQGWYYQEMVTYAKISETLINPYSDWMEGRLSTAQYYDAVQTFEDSLVPGNIIKAIWNHRLLTGMLLPAISKSVDKAQYIQVRHDQALIACALERYFLAESKYPGNLSELTPKYFDKIPLDKMSAKSFNYKVDGTKGYLLYSVGKNLEDNNGQIALQKSGKNADINTSEGDWIWLISTNRLSQQP